MKGIEMKQIAVLLLIASVLPVQSCSRNSDTDKARRIPMKELVPILTDLYVADGLLAYYPVRQKFNARDSIANYFDIIEKHGYTKKSMDLTMKHYFVKDPEKLQEIYDQVLARLSEIQSDIQAQETRKAEFNLWSLKPSYMLPNEGIHNPLFFSIQVKDTGIYTLSFDYVLYSDDQSLNPRTTVFFRRDNKTENGEREMWERSDLIKDGEMHRLTISKRLTDTTWTHISGWLHDCDDQPGRWEKHSMFSNFLLFKGVAE